ncbi:unnamed protein product [Camellia sinensis]
MEDRRREEQSFGATTIASLVTAIASLEQSFVVTSFAAWFIFASPSGRRRPANEANGVLVFEDLLERAREKEEKEAKKRQRFAKDFTDLLSTIKEITASSIWEESKQLFEESSEYRSIGEDSFAKEVFEEHLVHLLEKAKEKERKREEEKYWR